MNRSHLSSRTGGARVCVLRCIRLHRRIAVLAALVGFLLVSQTTRADEAVVRVDVPGLPNAYRVTPDVISGGLPDAEVGFATLQKLGVRTVISVDGAKPDVAGAKQHGLRYVHLPHGYDAVPEDRVLDLARAITQLPGPIYIHCHHGKHRSPAATAAACIATGLISRDVGRQVLEVAGTGKNYVGLYQSVDRTRTIEASLLRSTDSEFPEIAAVAPLAAAMVELDRVFHSVQQAKDADWKAPNGRPEREPAHLALILREHFAEIARSEQVMDQSEGFDAILARSLGQAHDLEKVLGSTQAGRGATASKLFESIRADCRNCHRDHRD